MSKAGDLSPTTRPPDSLVAVYKFYQKVSADALARETNVLDLHRAQDDAQNTELVLVRELDRHRLVEVFAHFEGSEVGYSRINDAKVYEHRDLPGLQFLPSLLPEHTQKTLLSRLLHRDLVHPSHKTNVHFHHNIPYHQLSSNSQSDASSSHSSQGFSFFQFSPDCSLCFPAVDPHIHKPLTLYQFLNRKLRWMTLGGQYDWTRKAYPEGSHPEFPGDIAKLTHGIFPDIQPEAAIVNFYSLGDSLSIHRDVSEDSDAGLVSISFGCDGIFIAGLEDSSTKEVKHIVVRLRSGDAIYMSGPSRFAWHGVPQILANTCPQWLSDWPADTCLRGATSNCFEAWRGWMASKRINLNIRQMKDKT